MNPGETDALRPRPNESPLLGNFFFASGTLFWKKNHVKSVRSDTNTDVSSDAADVEIGDLFLSDQLLHVGCAQFLVVKEGGVGINVGIETFLDCVALGVDLGTKVVCSLKIL